MAAREYFTASYPDEISTTSDTTWQGVVSLPFTPAEGADYIVFWSVELINKSTTVYDARCRIVTDGAVSVEFGQESRGSIEYPSYFGFYRFTGGGVAQTVALEVMAEVSGQVIYARNANLVALRLGPGDQYVEALGRVAVTGGTDTWADVASLTWAPDAGEYLVLGHSLTDNYAATAPVYGRLVFDGVGNKEATAGHAEVTGPPKNLTPIHQMWKRTVPASGVSRSAVWQGRSHNTGSEVGWGANRLLILKLAGFDAAFYAELSSLLTVDDAAYVPMVSTTGAAGAGPHLLLGSWGVAGSSTSAVMDVQVVDQGVRVGRAFQKSMSSASNRGQTGGHVGLRSYDPGERTWSLDLKAEGAFMVYGRPGSSIAVLNLGLAGRSLVAPQGTYAGTGLPAGLGAVRKLTGVRGAVVLAGLSASLSRGFRFPIIEGSLGWSVHSQALSAARRVRASTNVLLLAGRAAALDKVSAGVRYVVVAGAFTLAFAVRGAGLIAARRVANSVGAVAQAGLEAVVRRGLAVRCGTRPLVFEAESVKWGRTYVMCLRSGFLAFQAASSPLRYSGQQFWTAASSIDEAWIAATPTLVTWSYAQSIPEHWVGQC